jgi:hypothetical protein
MRRLVSPDRSAQTPHQGTPGRGRRGLLLARSLPTSRGGQSHKGLLRRTALFTIYCDSDVAPFAGLPTCLFDNYREANMTLPTRVQLPEPEYLSYGHETFGVDLRRRA